MIFINVNIDSIKDMAKNLSKVQLEAIKMAERDLVPAIYSHIQEEARKKLHSTQQLFLDNISLNRIDDNTWMIVLDAKYRWIDDGMRPHEMIDNLTKNGKTNKKGDRYKVIPFFHGPGRGPAHSTQYQTDLQSAIRAELRSAKNELTGKKGIPYSKIETDSSGNPLIGKLHSLNVETGPTRIGAGRWAGAGQGWGPIGAVRQGYTGTPFLRRVEIYQKMMKQKDGTEKLQRAIFTFRTVSTSMKGSGQWFHPGVTPANIFEEAEVWGRRMWETEVLPKLLEKINQML